jgi:hypothetical protein
MPRDERPFIPPWQRRAQAVDFTPTQRELDAGKTKEKPLSLHERRQRAARSSPEPIEEQDELGEGERQMVKRAVRDLRGD